MKSKHVCPKCGGTMFYTVAHVMQEWLVDEDGNWLKTTEDCCEVTHEPDDDNIWTCSKCGTSGVVVPQKIEGGHRMKVIRYDNEGPANRTEYETGITNIREAAKEYGYTEDTLERYSNSGELVGIATWPQGSKVYKYCDGANLDANPVYRVFVY